MAFNLVREKPVMDRLNDLAPAAVKRRSAKNGQGK